MKALGEALRELLTDQDRLAALRAEAPAVAAAWSPERSMEALATTIAAVVQAPSRRR